MILHRLIFRPVASLLKFRWALLVFLLGLSQLSQGGEPTGASNLVNIATANETKSASVEAKNESTERPNILWLSVEDISPHLGCYGDSIATTPHLDQFAKQSILYRNAFATAGVCAPSRSAIITGMYQTSIGTQHMRCLAQIPKFIKPFPTYLRNAGYFCTNNSKTDYQFTTPKDCWDQSNGKAHWKNRDKDQPFFAVFNFTGCHESGIENNKKYAKITKGIKKHDRKITSQTLPPYYPKTKEVLDDWGRNYDLITATDRWVAEKLKEIDDAGLRDNTIVFFWSDHGIGLPRAKRWLYDSGMKVPLMVRIPKKHRTQDRKFESVKSDQLVSLIDLGPTVLQLAGIPIPTFMHGQPFIGNQNRRRSYVYGARDRMDERYDIIRAVRDQQFKYIRNYEPWKPYYQYMNTPEKGRTMMAIRTAAFNSPLPGVAKFLATSKPVEELYDTLNDPHEMKNLANEGQYQQTLQRMRNAHFAWVAQTRDTGLLPEAYIREQSEKLGSPYAIFAGEDGASKIARLRDAASLSLKNIDSIDEMISNLEHPDAGIRYWSAIGIGNIDLGKNKKAKTKAETAITSRLNDPSENVRVAVARALCKMDKPAEALPVLVKILDDGSQWARVHAANVLDEIDQQAVPVIDAMKRNLSYRPKLVSEGKYTVRVLNRALNELEGTENRVK